MRFRFAIDSDTLKPALKWHVTYGHDSVFTFHVAPGDLVGGHVFWVSAEDNDGKIDHTPAKRYFSIRTVPPTSQITGGPASGAVAGPTTTFSWSGNDPDGSETGGPVPVDSFEYMLLRPGTSFDGNHTPLPVSLSPTMLALLNEASGNSLPAPYDDWKWTATSARSHTFTGLDPASYVFAVRAVDAAGAHSVLQAPRNVRGFWVTPSPERQSAPWMRITSEALTLPITSDQSPIDGPSIRQRFSILDGEPVSFSWVGLPSLAGYP
ncbi:MAG TPA: hypothetical protein VFM00_04250, partial [Candidatus Eisenbacteria bacterium]|nr:hypothetical protein [Candidatus Eisenbacteria bacterium]